MEISGEIKTPSPSQPIASASGETPQPAKLPAGSTLKGEITDLKQDQVTIRTENGDVVTAKLDAPADAAIGQERNFTVRYSGGQLTLSVNEAPNNALQKNVISDALNSLGFKNTPENIKLAEIILNNNLPMTKETLLKLNQAMKLMGPENLDKALFLMDNEMRLNSQNAETLNGFLNGETKIQSQIKELVADIDKLPAPIKNALTEILLKGETTPNTGSTQPANTAVNPKIGLAFNNVPLSAEHVDKLARELIKEFPENSALIEKLAGEKKAFIESVAEAAAKPEIAAKLSDAIRTNTLTPELFNRILKEAGIKMSDSLNPGSQLTDSSKLTFAPESTRNEIKYILENLLRQDNTIKEKAMELLKTSNPDNSRETDASQKLLSRLSFALNSTDPKEIDNYLNGLRDNLQLAKNQLSQLNLPESQQILKSINNINQNLEFVSQLKNNIFFQLPITVNGHDTNTELFVFKDKRRSSNAKKGGSASAMIALDTVNLGRFETYVQKTGNSVSCQFRLESETIERLVRANLPKLEQMLENYNYSLDTINFHSLDGHFCLMDAKPSDNQNITVANDGYSRIAFDIRT